MITKDDVERTTSKERVGEPYCICFHCEKNIGSYRSIRILKLRDDGIDKYKNGRLKYIDFHIDCWKIIAGEEYCFSEE